MKWLALLLALTFALAGCAGDDGGAETDLETDSSTETSQDPHDGSQGEPEHDDGGIVLREVALNVTGFLEAPADVTFTINVTGLEDGTIYAFDFGDGTLDEGPVTSPEWNLSHTYDAGLHTAILNVTFQDGQVLNASIQFQVQAGAPASGTFLAEQAETFAGTITLGTQGAEGCALTGMVDLAEHTFSVPATVDELPVAMGNLHVLMQLGDTNLDSDIYMYGPGGELIGSGTKFNFIDGATEEFTAEGPLPAGDYRIEVQGCTGINAEYTIEVTADLVVA